MRPVEDSKSFMARWQEPSAGKAAESVPDGGGRQPASPILTARSVFCGGNRVKYLVTAIHAVSSPTPVIKRRISSPSNRVSNEKDVFFLSGRAERKGFASA